MEVEFNSHSPPDQSPRPVHPLSSKQERKLVEYVEDKFLDLTRNYKKRNHPSTTLPTLCSYLEAAHPLLALILQIPPLRTQAALRTALLLRLTGEVLTSFAGYEPEPPTEALPALLAWLDELDRGWLAVLRAQSWDPAQHEGVDIELPLDASLSHLALDSFSDAGAELGTLGSAAVSQTDRTRLRSLLLSGSTRLEEWLEAGLHVEGASDLETALERLGFQQSFDDLFVRTLSEMGDFAEALAEADVPAC